MTTLEVLKAARSLVARGWMQGDYADAPLVSRRCTCWCASGAVLDVCGLTTALHVGPNSNCALALAALAKGFKWLLRRGRPWW